MGHQQATPLMSQSAVKTCIFADHDFRKLTILFGSFQDAVSTRQLPGSIPLSSWLQCCCACGPFFCCRAAFETPLCHIPRRNSTCWWPQGPPVEATPVVIAHRDADLNRVSVMKPVIQKVCTEKQCLLQLKVTLTSHHLQMRSQMQAFCNTSREG